MFVYILKGEIGYIIQLSFVNFNKFKIAMKWLCSSLLCYNNFSTKADTGDKIEYYKLSNNTETQQKNTKKNTS